MTTDVSAAAADANTAHDDAHDEHHPSDTKYIKIALILGVITGAEVSTYFFDLGSALAPTVLAMMFVKFWIVAQFFMHLKFDHKILNWIFMFGLALTTVVYVGVLLTFRLI